MIIQFQSANHAPFLGKCLNLALSPSFGHLAPGELKVVLKPPPPPDDDDDVDGGESGEKKEESCASRLVRTAVGLPSGGGRGSRSPAGGVVAEAG